MGSDMAPAACGKESIETRILVPPVSTPGLAEALGSPLLTGDAALRNVPGCEAVAEIVRVMDQQHPVSVRGPLYVQGGSNPRRSDVTDITPGDGGIADDPQTKKPFYKRWWFIALAVLFGLAIIGGIVDAGEDDEAAGTTVAPADITSSAETEPVASSAGVETTTTAAETTTTAEATTTTTTEATTTTTTEATTTTTQPLWESFTVEGRGDDVIDFGIPGDEAAVLEFTHTGSSNFAVISYTAAADRIDLLVNTIGSYTGARPANFLSGEEISELEITADGPWTVTARPLAESPMMDSISEGSGDEVLLYVGDDSRLTATHDGDSNFAIWAWSTNGRDLLVNEIGPYEGTVRIDPAAMVIEISADGNWTLQTS